MLKVFLGGEGNNDIGTRGYAPIGEDVGVVEALLRRVRPAGWRVAGARSWQSIRKYRAGAATKEPPHRDAHNVRGLVLHAYEDACEMLAFVRDVDGEDHREDAIRGALETIGALGFADEYGYELAIVGGFPRPKLEGWILCLRGVAGTDEMSRARVDRELQAMETELKSTAHYVEIVENSALPTEGSLSGWLAEAEATFRRLIDGER